jgi:microcystin-dependent protein
MVRHFATETLHGKVETMDFYLGQICYFAYTRSFDGWLPCDGRLLNIMQYQALYSLLGNAYGGDGRTTFALPDLRGRVAVGINPQSLPDRIPATGQGATGGSTNLNIPASSHVVTAAAPAQDGATVTAQTSASETIPLPPPPYAGVGAFICISGVYPLFN